MQTNIEAFVKFKHILKHYWMCLYRILFSSTQFICFFLMILDHLFNGSIMTMIYVVSIFAYGLIKQCRPSKFYWTFMLFYAELMLGIKLVIQLDILKGIKDMLNSVFLAENRWGLKVFDSNRTLSFFLYIFFDCLIIFGILVHEYVLIFTGIYDKSETEQETIDEAIDRVASKNDDSDSSEEELDNEEQSDDSQEKEKQITAAEKQEEEEKKSAIVLMEEDKLPINNDENEIKSLGELPTEEARNRMDNIEGLVKRFQNDEGGVKEEDKRKQPGFCMRLKDTFLNSIFIRYKISTI